MSSNAAIVVTSISAPNVSLKALANGARTNGLDFLVMGDTKSPSSFKLEGCDFYDITRQERTGFSYAKLCPTRSYARKNIGYLVAMRGDAPLIVETDDDNLPRDGFWHERHLKVEAHRLAAASWANIYSFFTDVTMWPRGLPLDAVLAPLPDFDSLPVSTAECPIQQGLADGDPDVDAIYRLTLPLPQNFRADRRIILDAGTWCPFNSQNTTWWPQVYPLMYLPAYCSFRMTDIWRSFVAQRIAWANGWSILFHEPTVWQDRNDHDLMRDFSDEVPGYLNNRKMSEALDQLDLKRGIDQLGANLLLCYEELIAKEWVGEKELGLVTAWTADIAQLQKRDRV